MAHRVTLHHFGILISNISADILDVDIVGVVILDVDFMNVDFLNVDIWHVNIENVDVYTVGISSFTFFLDAGIPRFSTRPHTVRPCTVQDTSHPQQKLLRHLVSKQCDEMHQRQS